MIPCEKFKENICAYIDNELNNEERLSFEEHARHCRGCKRELDEMIRIVTLCRSLPQQELPTDFKAELHERLVAVAGRQDRHEELVGHEEHEAHVEYERKVTGIKRPKGFLFMKSLAAVAAGLLLVFLAGIYFRYGMGSPFQKGSTANDTALTMQKPSLAAAEGAVADSAANKQAAQSADGTGNLAITFGAPAEPAASGEVDRSAVIKNRDAAAAELESGSESVNSMTSTITVFAVSPGEQIEKIKLLAEQNSGEILEIPQDTMADGFKTVVAQSELPQTNGAQNKSVASDINNASGSQSSSGAGSVGNTGAVSAGSSGTASVGSAENATAGNTGKASNGNVAVTNVTQVSFIILNTQYDRFVAKLYAEYGATNVQPGALVTEDVTEALNSSIAESDDLDAKIQSLQKEDSVKNSAEIEDLKARKESNDKRIDELRLGNDFVIVKILINGK